MVLACVRETAQVSGLPHKWRAGMYERFLAALEAERPALVAPYTALLAKKAREAALRHRACGHVHNEAGAGAGTGTATASGDAVSFSMFGADSGDDDSLRAKDDGGAEGSSGTAATAGGFTFNFG